MTATARLHERVHPRFASERGDVQEEDEVDDGAEYSGRTVEDAVGRAAEELGVAREQLLIDVVSSGSRGVFGIGAEDARIRASIKVEGAGNALRERDAITGSQASGGLFPATELDGGAGVAVANAVIVQETDEDLAASAVDVLRTLLSTMNVDADVMAQDGTDPVMLTVSGENLGVLIGRRGDNLSALQFIVNLILSKNRRQWPRVVIDVENYRARREDSLRSLAERIAYRVSESQRPFTLEAMSASDRRIIHLSLRDNPNIETYSIGESLDRRVVVAPCRSEEFNPPA